MRKKLKSLFRSLFRKIIKPIVKTKQNKLDEFDSQYYLAFYHDVAASGMDPYLHFINHGKAEGRKSSRYNIKKNVEPLCKNKETALIVSHDASRTGAPILALNIAQELKKQFNIVVLLLNDGNITSFFEQACNAIIGVNTHGLSTSLFIKNLISQLIQEYSVKFSIVNSIESFCVLEPLANYFIPTLLLIHEFSAYTRPRQKLVDALLWAGTVVFPAKIVQKNATHWYNELAMRFTHVLPQGKSIVPTASSPLHKEENIIHFYNKPSLASKPFIILGAGSVSYRKGVDLFIATAAELKRSHPTGNIKMLWVGGGYDPENDLAYSAYLAEQIERSKLDDYFELLDELADIDQLYKEIDLFYLSSRLDPLPNVAIDVMMLGKPLICFDEGTGIADILKQDPDTAQCVVPHLSIIEATKKIIQLYQAPTYYAFVSAKIQELAHRSFNMKNYVSRLLALLEGTKNQTRQEEHECAALNNSDFFKADFFAMSPHTDRKDAIRKYIRSWHSKAGLLRKPEPGFNPVVYDAHHDYADKQPEPFTDYIRLGRPDGPWKEKIITPTNKHFNLDKTKTSYAIHIHAFHPDFLKDILERIQVNKSTFDIYISTTKSAALQVADILLNYKNLNTSLRVAPNQGRNPGPLLSEFAAELQKYPIIGHFHTKKSVDITNTQFTRDRFVFLLENLLGGKHQMADRIIHEFQQVNNLGFVFADDPHVLDWGKNKTYADAIAKEIGLLSPLPNYCFNFPIGTMFWARPAAIEPLLNLQYTWKYPEKPVPSDGSILHALERIMPFIVSNQGFIHATTHVPGLTR